ncbi:MAG: RNA 2',3'-cyclic phosphodiesterase [Allosphingosinicella sp.]
MQRLFVAIRPPLDIRERLLAAMGGVSGARWQDEDQLHLTLRFIGEVDRHAARDVDAALAAVHHPRFEMALAGLGSFERRGEPVALWAGVAPHEPLKALHNKIDQALSRAGLEAERRAYTPHITLARLPRGSGSVRGAIETNGGLASPPFPVEEFSLFESRLTPEGPLYTRLERYALD